MRFIRYTALVSINVSLCLAAASAAVAAPRDQQLFADAAARTVVGKATGAILVARGGQVLWTGSVGDPAKGIPAPAPSAVFDALSIGKTFTAIAAQRLAAEGRLDLSASIRQYIPELPDSFAPITVQNCLDNASGWGAYLNDKSDFDPESTAQLIEDLQSAERIGKRGEYKYSNTGFQALGLVIQRVTGKPFKQAMKQLVFQPAKLDSTHFFGDPKLQRLPVATGWKDGHRTGSPRTWPSTWSLTGAAGIATTVRDLYRLNRAYLAGPSLGRGARERMLQDGVLTGGRAPYREPGRTVLSYGSGLYHWRDAQGRHVHFHGGDGEFGFHALMFWREEDDLVVIGLFNSGDPSATFDRGAFIEAFATAARPAARTVPLAKKTNGFRPRWAHGNEISGGSLRRGLT